MDKEGARARGMEHRNNKKKYNKNKAATHVRPPKQKVALDSNWDRYEQKETENIVNSSMDFSLLANAPITRGSHFQFKSDKDILEISEAVTTSALFNLDLALLEKSLSTIPFSVRSGISDDVFSENQHRVMTALEDNIHDYDTYLRSHQSKKPDVVFGSDGDSSGDSDVEKTDEPVGQESPKISAVGAESAPQRKEPGGDLEQWLDDILDD